MNKKELVHEMYKAYEMYKDHEVKLYKDCGGKFNTPQAVQFIDTKLNPILAFIAYIDNK